MSKTAIVYTTEISANIKNAFKAWAEFFAEKQLAEAKRKKAKKKVQLESEVIQLRKLFNTFATACEKENRNLHKVADELRK